MFGIMIATHGQMAAGIRNAAEMIMGKQEYFEIVSLLAGDSLEGMGEKMIRTIEGMGTKENIIFVDLPGATPNNSALLVSSEHDGWRAITGVNLVMVLEGLALRSTPGVENLDSFVDRLCKAGRESIGAVTVN